MTLDASTVVGTWEMVEAWDIGDDPQHPHEKTYPWGNPSSGYWVYDRGGHFSLMITQNPPLPIPADPFSSSTPPTTQPAWLAPAKPWEVPHSLLIESFATAAPYAYFGTYTVELDDHQPHLGGTINMTVFADVLRAYTSTLQQRSFLFDGSDYLNVGVPGEYLRRLRRLT